MEKAISLEGSRDDLKMPLQQSVVHHQKIPFGKFILNIALPSEIETTETKLERDNGLHKIRCPKKKVTAVYLE